MKLSILRQLGFRIKTQKNQKIKDKVVDFLVDENTWKIKYLKLQRTGLIKSETYFIPVIFVNTVDFKDKCIKLYLNSSEIHTEIEEEPITVTEEIVEKQSQLFRKQKYWQRKFRPPATIPSVTHNYMIIPDHVEVQNIRIADKEIHSNLRSVKELKGYEVDFAKGKNRVVKDFILDTINWRIKEVVVGKRFSFPWNTEYLLNTNHMNGISAIQNKIYINNEVDSYYELSEYEASKPVNKNVFGVYFDYKGFVQEK